MQLILLVIIETSAFEKHLLSTRKVYCVIFIMIVTYFLKLSWIHRPAKRAVFAAQRQKQNGQIRDRKKLSNLFFFYFPCFLYHVERILGDKHMICQIPPPQSTTTDHRRAPSEPQNGHTYTQETAVSLASWFLWLVSGTSLQK